MLPQLVSFRHSSVSFDPQAKTCSGRKTIWEAGLTSYKNTLEARAKQVFNSGGQPWAAEDSANFFINCSKAFALIAQGTVTADLPAGADGNVEISTGWKLLPALRVADPAAIRLRTAMLKRCWGLWVILTLRRRMVR